MVAPCISAHIVKIGNLSLSVATVVFVLPVAINMPWNALPVCLLNSWMWIIDIAFLPLMKISGTSFSMTGLCSTVFFTRWTVSSLVCFFNWINPKTLPQALSWFYTLSAETSNGTLIFTVSSRKGDLAMMVSGAMSNILTTTFFAMPSVPLYWMKWRRSLVLRLKRWNPDVTVNINKDSTFMQNRIFVTLRTLSNTSGVILAVLSLLHPESTTMMGILLLSITIAMRIINT